MEEQIMNMELVKGGDDFTASEMASRLKVTTRCAKVLLEGLVIDHKLVSDVRKSYTVFRLRVTPFINTLRLANYTPPKETFRGWL